MSTKTQTVKIFVITFLIALPIHLFIWTNTSVRDEQTWINRIQYLESHIRKGPGTVGQHKYSEHPNTPLLLLGFSTHVLGLNEKYSLSTALSILIAIATAGAVTTAYALRPNSIWYVAVAAILTAHPLYAETSPVDAAMATLTTLTTFLLIYAALTKNISALTITFIGIAAGATLATRVHFALIYFPIALVILSRQLSVKFIVNITLQAVGWFIVFNPILWLIPVQHLKAVFIDQVRFFTGAPLLNKVVLTPISISDFFLFAPFALLSVAIGCYYVLSNNTSPIYTVPLAAILAATGLTSTVMLLSDLQSIRYFFPIFFVWETLLPLFVIQLIELLKVKTPQKVT